MNIKKHFLYEKRKKEHPLDGVKVGLELEFVYEYRDHDDSVPFKTQEEIEEHYSDSVTTRIIFEEHVQPMVEKFFKNYEIIYADTGNPTKEEDFFDGNIIYATKDNSMFSVIVMDDDYGDYDEEERFITDYIVNYGYELITPPFFKSTGEELEKQLYEILNKFKKMIDTVSDFRTNESSGAHINISLVDNDISNFLKAVLTTMYDQSFMIEEMEVRKGFARNSLDVLKNFIKISPEPIIDTLTNPNERKFDMLMNFVAKLINDEKYVSIRPKEKHFEFRVIGGMDYHKDVDHIMENIKKFASLVKKPEKKLQKKAQELVKIIYRKTIKEIEKRRKTEIINKLHSEKIDHDLIEKLTNRNIEDWSKIMIEKIREYMKKRNTEDLEKTKKVIEIMEKNKVVSSRFNEVAKKIINIFIEKYR